MAMLQRGAETPLRIRGGRESRPREVFILRPVRDRGSMGLRPSTVDRPRSWLGEGRARGRGEPIGRLCEMLSRFLGRPVVDETGLDGVYDWDLPYQPQEPEVVMEALRKRLGLEVVPDLRRVRSLMAKEDDAS